MRWISCVLAVALVMVALPALGHSDEWLDDWESQWMAQVTEEGLSVELALERADMVSRHTDQFSVVVTAGVPVGEAAVSGPGRWESLIQIHFQPDDWAWARRVLACESGGNPYAENPVSSASGLFQFLDSTWQWASEGAGQAGADVYDASVHVEVAAWLYYTYGPSQWSCK